MIALEIESYNVETEEYGEYSGELRAVEHPRTRVVCRVGEFLFFSEVSNYREAERAIEALRKEMKGED